MTKLVLEVELKRKICLFQCGGLIDSLQYHIMIILLYLTVIFDCNERAVLSPKRKGKGHL